MKKFFPPEEKNIDNDYKYSRDTYYELVEKGKQSLELMIEVARESEHPRAFEVLSGMIKNISDTDNRILTNWIASVMVQHPQIDIEMSISDIEFYNRSIALLFEDLLTVRCKQETAEALTFESEEAFASAFEVLGIVSMEKLIEHPTVISASENVINYIDLNKLSKIFE